MDLRIPWEALREKALAARERAYAPYSNFRVGAALWAASSEQCGVPSAASQGLGAQGFRSQGVRKGSQGHLADAAPVASEDSIFVGCNVENASFGATLCAERVAVGAAVVSGVRRLGALVVASTGDDFPYPCGICRQVLVEFAPDLPIVLLKRDGERELSLEQLLPFPFVTFAEEPRPDRWGRPVSGPMSPGTGP